MAEMSQSLRKTTPLFMIGPENHPLKLGALEYPYLFENKQYSPKSSMGKEKTLREMRKYFELMESETPTPQVLWAAVISHVQRGVHSAWVLSQEERAWVLGLLRAQQGPVQASESISSEI